MDNITLNNIKNDFFIPINNGDKLDISITNIEDDAEISLFVNSLRCDFNNEIKSKTISFNEKINMDNSFAHISFNPNETNTFNFNFTLTKNIGGNSFIFDGKFEPIVIKNSNKKRGQSINNDNTSFMVLRTNPKLTGNIKLVVDSKNNLYIDTFNINETLSNAKYKHNLVSGKSHYCNDVRNVFGKLPKNELYKILDENYEMFSPKNELHKQYVDTYFYGVKNNTDKLYSENFSLLAPLYIKDTLPDFFLIFKMNGATNKDCSTLSSTDRIKYFLENGKIVKCFDLRKNSPIGNYIRNIKNDFKDFSNPAYLSLNNYVYNEWSGISVSKGIVGTSYESFYNLSQTKNQVDYDRYITNGFERNGLISPHLINFEFMFNDDEGDNFSINRYFGLYVSNNIFDTFYSINGEIYDNDFNLYNIPNYPLSNHRIYNLTTDKQNSFKRFYDVDSIKKYIKTQSNIPYQNALSITSSINNEVKEYFMCLNINNPLKTGEHLKVINESKNEIYEVIISNVNKENYNSIEDFFEYENDSIINYHRNITSFRNIAAGYNNDLDNVLFNTSNKKEIIKKQIQQIIKSFNSILPNDVDIRYSDSNIYISSNDKMKFERISSTFTYSNKIYNNDNKEDITYFNEKVDGVLLDIFSSNDTMLYPINIPTFGNRICYVVDFVKIDKSNTTYNIPNIELNNDIYKSILLFKDNDNIIPINRFEIKYKTKEGKKTIYKNIINYSNKCNIINLKTTNTFISNINLYYPLPFNLSIAGILPIKDFNFNVLDNKSTIISKDKFTQINGKDVYDSSKTIDGSIVVDAIRKNSTCENILNYIDLYYDDSSFSNKDNYNNIINDFYNKSIRKMNIPLVTPMNCKWKLKGKDFLNNKIKSTIFINDSSSYYLNIDNSTNLFGFPFDSEKVGNEFYIYNDIMSIDDKLKCTLRDKILYYGGNMDDVVGDNNKFSSMYWNKNSNSLETIIFGQKIKISNKKIDLSIFNNSLFTIICSPSSNNDTTPIEIIFDKNNNKVLCVWYYANGNASLEGKTSYNKKTFSNDCYFIKCDANANLKNVYNNKYIPLSYNNCKNALLGKNIFISALSNNKNYSEDTKNLTYNFKCDSLNEYVLYDSSYNYIESKEDKLCYNTTHINETNNIGNIYIVDGNKIVFNNQYNFNSFKNILNNINVNYFIIDNDKTNMYKDNLVFTFVDPISVKKSLSLNKNIDNDAYTYNGYVEPDFIDMFIFENDDSISNELGINLINSNTNIKQVNNINQIWYNKVTDGYNYSHPDTSTNALLSFDFSTNFDITKTCWDNNFYIKYSKNDNVKYINGYESKKDNKTFFGSHAMIIKDNTVEITDWTNAFTLVKGYKSYNNYDDKTHRHIIELNISKALLSFFLNKNEIKDNWSFNKNSMSFANNYIKNLIESIYDINNKNSITIYKRDKTNKDNIFVKYENNSNFVEVKNIELKLTKVNEEYILTIELPIDSYEYSVKYTLKK